MKGIHNRSKRNHSVWNTKILLGCTLPCEQQIASYIFCVDIFSYTDVTSPILQAGKTGSVVTKHIQNLFNSLNVTGTYSVCHPENQTYPSISGVTFFQLSTSTKCWYAFFTHYPYVITLKGLLQHSSKSKSYKQLHVVLDAGCNESRMWYCHICSIIFCALVVLRPP